MSEKFALPGRTVICGTCKVKVEPPTRLFPLPNGIYPICMNCANKYEVTEGIADTLKMAGYDSRGYKLSSDQKK